MSFKVIVMGNAPSVLFNEFGNKIDKFDKVIRINNYVIQGYEKYVGTKTHIYVRSHNYEFEPYDALEYEEVWLKSHWTRWEKKLGILPLKNMKKAMKEKENIKTLPHKGSKIEASISYKISKTSGLQAIEQAIQRFYVKDNPIYIYGFNFFNRKIDGYMETKCHRPHYFLNEPPGSYKMFTSTEFWKNDYNVERKMVLKWIDEGKVKPLFEKEIQDEPLDYSDFEPCVEYIPEHLVGRIVPGSKIGPKEEDRIYPSGSEIVTKDD